MAGIVGQAFVQVEPVVAGFRQKVAAGVTRSLGTIAVPVPVQPVVAPGALKSSTQLGESFLTTSASASALRASMLGVGAATGATIIGFTALGAGLFTFLSAAKSSVTAAADLEQQLNVFRVVAGASADEMERISEEAVALGADLTLPAVSANDAAFAMTELAKAGLTVDQALDAARGTLQLAAAAQLDVASAAELAGSALNAFQLSGEDATRVADLLAGAANAAQGSMGDFGFALSQSAAVAHQAGISIEDTTVLLTALARAGIQGSDAGTSLRTALLRLIAPTSQARRVFETLNIQITDALGNVRTDVFEQLRISLSRLEPATRNATLALLFGADAVRAAAVFTREGAAGFNELSSQVTRAGQAAEIAGARAEGFSGAVAGLQSNLETLGTTLGGAALPALTDFVSGLSEGVAAANDLAGAIKGLNDSLGAIPGADIIGRANDLRKSLTDFLPGIPGARLANISPLGAGIKFVVDQFRDGEKAAEGFKKATLKIGTPLETIGQEIGLIGELAGKNFGAGVSDGIVKTQAEAVTAARKTLAQVILEGKRMVAEAIRAGNIGVEQAAFDAKRNLVTIGGELASLAAEFVDTGPLGQRIAALQARLDVSRTGLERGRLRRSLRDAQQELAQAERAIATAPGQTLTAQQRRAVEQFLTPFKEKVKDAQAALEEFSTEGVISKLQRQADQQKQVVQRGIADLIAQFNTGKIDLNTLNKETIALLRQNIPGFAKAGGDQGAAFRQQWMAQLLALQRQARAIVVGPQTGRTGFEPTVVSPAAAAEQARKDVADARAAAAARNVQATKDVEKALTGKKGTNELLAKILKELEDGAAPRRPTPVPSPGPRTTRRGGR